MLFRAADDDLGVLKHRTYHGSYSSQWDAQHLVGHGRCLNVKSAFSILFSITKNPGEFSVISLDKTNEALNFYLEASKNYLGPPGSDREGNADKGRGDTGEKHGTDLHENGKRRKDNRHL